jgi:hypothetical protein
VEVPRHTLADQRLANPCDIVGLLLKRRVVSMSRRNTRSLRLLGATLALSRLMACSDRAADPSPELPDAEPIIVDAEGDLHRATSGGALLQRIAGVSRISPVAWSADGVLVAMPFYVMSADGR